MDSTTVCVDALSELFYQSLKETEDLTKSLEYCATIGPFIIRAAFIKSIHRFDDEIKRNIPKSWRIKDMRKRTIITLLGAIPYKRRIYIDEYGCRRCLLDEILGISTYQRIEPNAFKWIVKRAADVSFKKTCEAFKDKTGAAVTRQTVMRCVHKAGDLLAEEGTVAKGSAVSTPVVFVEFDGFWVNLQTETKSPPRTRYTYKAQFRKKSCEMKVWVSYAGKVGNKRIGAAHWASDEAPVDFFSECMELTARAYDLSDADFVTVGADGATWCKKHELDEFVAEDTQVISNLDVYHINQKVYKAFSSEEDRSFYLDFLYKKDFEGFFAALEACMEDDADNERIEKRRDLYSYIENNQDWLAAPSLTRQIRERLACELPSVFGDRDFLGHLQSLLSQRRYKRFLRDLERIVARCKEELEYDYFCFLDDAREAIRLIKLYGPMRLGTMEGTNSKVYAARLKVWGCAWSRRGAIAMMRVRAAIASGAEIIAPAYDGWISERDKERIAKSFPQSSKDVAASCGKGWEPPKASMIPTANIPPSFYHYLRG